MLEMAERTFYTIARHMVKEASRHDTKEE